MNRIYLLLSVADGIADALEIQAAIGTVFDADKSAPLPGPM